MRPKLPDDVYVLVDERTLVTQDMIRDVQNWMIAVVVVVAILTVAVIGLIVFKVRLDRRQEKRVNRIADIAEGHGRITDNQKGRIEEDKNRIEEVVTSASAGAAQAAQKADQATQKVEDAVQLIGLKQAQMAKEVHTLAEKVDKLIRKVCPDEGDSFHGKPNTGP